MTSPLDRPIWHALRGRQARFARGSGPALRFDPEVSPFLASADDGAEALAAAGELIGAGEQGLFLQAGPVPLPPGLIAVERGRGVQMVAVGFEPSDPPPDIVALGAADAAEMMALARLTRPGPFGPRTHELGGFFGVRGADGRLLAMAGERLRIEGMSEVSGVCTHPDARGRGLAERLSRHVASQIVRRGERPFLHAYADNDGAIRLYSRMGFELRREVDALLVEGGGGAQG